jgi:hypothetical protein
LFYHEEAGLPAAKNTALNLGQTTYYFRTHFNFSGDPGTTTLQLNLIIDDGCAVFLNGQEVYRLGLSAGASYGTFASRTVGDAALEGPFTISSAALRQGDNVLAVEVHQANSGSSDVVCGVSLAAKAGGVVAGNGPTPGARNSVFATNLPPLIRQVSHDPEQPVSGQNVRITAKVTDSDGVKSVQLQYQLVDPGNYIELTDAAYSTSWTSVPMNDAGASGDAIAGDDVYTAVLPGSLQTNRRLVRYRIVATDAGGRALTVPYADDPQPNFAYFVYDGVPAYRGAIQPGSTDQSRGQVTVYPESVMRSIPAYHLLSKSNSIAHCQFIDQYGGQEYRWAGTVVYDGKVYDHIHYRARGGVWRYAMGKNAWKIKFNTGHHLEARDNFGHKYSSAWSRMNIRPGIQQADYQHRGEQGMFEAVNYRLFNLAGVPACNTHFFQLRVIDDASESGATQYDGDFWGLYLGVEEGNGAFIDDHDLPDGNLYMMRNSSGTIQNQGRTAASDGSDLASFLNTFRNTSPTDAWWRTNLDLEKYYAYRTIIECFHHYDIDDPPGKNYFFYLNSETAQWSVHPWDMDLTWGDNMYGGGNEPFRSRVLPRGAFSIEYKNRGREIRDLLFNSEQAGQLIDETAAFIYQPRLGPPFTGADRAQWDYNPIMVSRYVNAGKAGQGLFYKFPLENVPRDFTGAIQLMKNYIVNRGKWFDQNIIADNAIPSTPELASAPAEIPVNRLTFHSSDYAGQGAFAAMKWRLAEITLSNAPAFNPADPKKYEINSEWETPELGAFANDVTVPSANVKVGHAYRVRVRVKDATGRWSHWSAPAQFIAAEPDNSTALRQNLRITEIMYNPPAGSQYEFIELHNASLSVTLDLSGVVFTSGIDFTFPQGTTVSPDAYLLVTSADPMNNFADFRAHYGMDANTTIIGPYSGALNNDGEQLTLKTAAAGTEILSFSYNDRSGWPAAPDGAGHSLVLRSDASKKAVLSLSYGGNWPRSTYFNGSPGVADPEPAAGVVINEIAANTTFSDSGAPEYTSNDWIELYNLGAAISLKDFYLSDDSHALNKWPVPPIDLPASGRISFDEITGFHHPITTGFGLSSAGEVLYLSCLPGNSQDRVVDAIRFKGQEIGRTVGRFPDGAEFIQPLLPTRDAANQSASAAVVISEVMYHPLDVTNTVESALEYVELHNSTGVAQTLATTNGPFRIDGGIHFTFPANAVLPSHGIMLLVSFDPSDAVASNSFCAFYGIGSSNVMLSGPFTGSLANGSDRVALEKPMPLDVSGTSPGWVVMDEFIYSDESGADGSGDSLQRVRFDVTASDPSNLRASAPTPGWISGTAVVDSDGDGLPDDWEIAHALNPRDPLDAAADQDNDGATALNEYFAGTDPRDARSRLELRVASGGSGVTLRFAAHAGRNYSIQARDTIGTGSWQTLKQIAGTESDITFEDGNIAGSQRYYRLLLEAPPSP